MGEQFKIIEYSLIILFIVTGSVFLISTSDLVSIFLSIELQSYGLYLLSTIYRDSEPATSGGLMYFLLGGLSSCFILLGTALLYANSGTTNLDSLYIITSISDDVYDAIPTVVTTFVAIIAKISIFIFLLELVHYTIIGTVVGLTQSRIKRLFAFSTISHVGFILLGLSIHTVESTQAFMFYLIQYSVSNLNAFILILTIGYSLYCYAIGKQEDTNKNNDNLTDVNNSPIQLIDQLKGYYYINPIIALSLGITLFSFAGIPPLIGFFGKQMILSAAIDNGYIFMALVAILTSVISAVYYLAIIKQIFFDRPDYIINEELKDFNAEGLITEKNFIFKKVNIKTNNIVISTSLSLSISVITLVITLFIFIPEELLSLANILALILFNL
ncbi:hypothetical protein COCC4DRAFT_66853 [Bipolaris maydis ATCC 48331]|uniref:NADH-ubiquinone oxidoreductase chain 2 n=2 Tax=Cochliobolus heterostrophus TaxID=5016 RepID=M2TEB0_COCH5|nr:uncharacterized protein COCC4DRAFT_66853 [Bipolaris maydis ATCC 48331]EMD84849.1 hypothetical protein COCHEDRAFT_1161856 [Bipolaris maydis C5]ENH99022.1 hypothetical protein COCC4DRAFT_66853 [Bipolaris maydis ATCC 48331]